MRLTISTVVAGMIVMFGTVSTAWALCETVKHGAFTLENVYWSPDQNRLTVEGCGANGLAVTVVNAGNLSEVIGTDTVFRRAWAVRPKNPASIPCRVRAEQSGGESDEKNVESAPQDCDDGSGS